MFPFSQDLPPGNEERKKSANFEPALIVRDQSSILTLSAIKIQTSRIDDRLVWFMNWEKNDFFIGQTVAQLN